MIKEYWVCGTDNATNTHTVISKHRISPTETQLNKIRLKNKDIRDIHVLEYYTAGK